MATDLGTARGRIIIDSSGARAGLTSAASGLMGFGKAALGLTAGLGIAVALRDTVNAAAEFEQQMSSLEAVTGATGGQMAKFEKQALKLGQSTKFSASEVAGAQVELAKAGVSTQEILGGALDSALALAAAGEVDLAMAAETVAGAMNAFSLSAGEAGRVADILAVTANTTATDVGDLSMSFQQGASAAKQAGLPIEDFTGLLGALAEANVTGSDAGTSLKAALLGIVAPLGRGEEAIKKYGLEFFDANGKIKGAVGIAKELERGLGKLNPQQRTAALQAIAGRDGFRALAAAMDLGAGALGRNIAASQKSGAAAETARVKQDNLRGDIEKLSGSIETLQIKAAGAFTGGLRVLAQGATAALDALSKSEAAASFGDGLIALGQGAASAVSAMAPLGAAVLSIASGVASAVGSLAGLAGAFLASSVGATTLRVAIISLGTAFAAIKLGNLAIDIAEVATSTVKAGQGLLAMATYARTSSGLLGALGTIAPVLGSKLGLVGLAVGVVAGGVALLASGAFQGASHAETMAAALDHVAAAAHAAAGGVSMLNTALSAVQEGNLRATETALGVERAQRTLNTAIDTYGVKSLEAREAQAGLARAQASHNAAIAQQAHANQGLTRSTAAQVVKLAELVTETRRGTVTAAGAMRIAKAFGLTQEEAAGAAKRFASDLAKVEKAGGDTGAKMNALRTFVRRAAESLDTTTKSGKETKAQLDRISQLDTAGISRFGQAYNDALAKGKTGAGALRDALKTIKPPTKLKLDAEDKATAKIKKVAGVKIPPKKATVDADVSGALAGISSVNSAMAALQDKTVHVTIQAHQKKGSWTVQEAVENITAFGNPTVAVTFVPKRSAAVEKMVKGEDILRAREVLSAKLAVVEAKEERRQEAAEKRRLTRAIANAQAELRRAKPGDERASATRELSSARAALREFRTVAKVEARRTGLEASIAARDGIIEGIRSGGEAVRSSVQDVGARIGEAIDRGLQAKLAALGDQLRATLADIASGPEAQRIAAIDVQVGGMRDARSARDAARQGTALAKTEADAAAVVQRRRDALARARTASEKQAAQALLDAALEEQRIAAEATADFKEDQQIAALERERAALEASLTLKREAAQTAHDDAVAAAQAEADARKAALDKQLGDLAESFANGLITRKQFNKRLAAIVGDPGLAADLERSGRELGLSFTRGLSRAIGSAEDAAEGLARAIAKYLKLRSPAETGPLAFNFKRSGSTLVREMVAGMTSQRAAVERAASGIAGAMAARGAMLVAAGGGGGGGFTQTNNITVDGPTLHPRTIAAQLAWEAQQAGRR